MVDSLHKMKVKTLLLSGDREANVQTVSNQLGIDEFHGGLTPEEKTGFLKERIDAKQGMVAFVGDGINDAPSIVLSDVGIAMGCLGSDAAVQNADIVLMNDDPTQVVLALKIAKKTERRAIFVIVCSLLAKLACMILAVSLPAFPLWAAVLADSGLAVAMVLVSLSLLWAKVKR